MYVTFPELDDDVTFPESSRADARCRAPRAEVRRSRKISGRWQIRPDSELPLRIFAETLQAPVVEHGARESAIHAIICSRNDRRRFTGTQIYRVRIGDRSLCRVAVPELIIPIISVALEGVVAQDDTRVMT